MVNPVLNYPWSSHEYSILVETGKMNNTQPEKTTHHVMYRAVYFEAYECYANVIKCYEGTLPPRWFEIWKHIRNIFINAVNQKCYEHSLSILKEMHERNSHSEILSVQSGQFAAFLA